MDGTYTAIDIAQIHKLDVKVVLAAAEGRGYPSRMSLEEAEEIIKELKGEDEVEMLRRNPCADETAETVVVPQWLNELAILIYERAYQEGYEDGGKGKTATVKIKKGVANVGS